MITVEAFAEKKRIPFIIEDFFVNYTGEIFDGNGTPLRVEEFNQKTGLSVTKDALVAVTYHRFNWPPIYWNDITVLSSFDSPSPENMVIGIPKSVASKEFPGFYMIPYFSNYVVSETGVLIKRSTGTEIKASQGPLGYYTFRMTSDGGNTQNQLRHRILCYAFKPYPVNVEDLDVTHIDGIAGNDRLSNLEWVSRTENNLHAVEIGLKSDNKEVAVRDCNTGRVYLYHSCSQAARALGVTETTISNRCKTDGYKSFGGLQFRFLPLDGDWPEIEKDGTFLAEFPDGKIVRCNGIEAARLAGMTRTSLLRMLREGRSIGKTNVKISKDTSN